MSVYVYRGDHTGPDLFDQHHTGRPGPSAYETMRRSEREVEMAYWYQRGCNDKEIAAEVGLHPTMVARWRREHGRRSNDELRRS